MMREMDIANLIKHAAISGDDSPATLAFIKNHLDDNYVMPITKVTVGEVAEAALQILGVINEPPKSDNVKYLVSVISDERNGIA